MDIPASDVRIACTRHGARAVLKAAYKRMAGDHLALPAGGLADAETFGEADRIGYVCYGSMTPEDRDAVKAEAAAALARLP